MIECRMHSEAPARLTGAFYFNNLKRICLSFFFFWVCVFAITYSSRSQERNTFATLEIARIKYQGGGDWYNDPSAIPNLCQYLNKNTGIDVYENEVQVSLFEESLFSYPIIFMTGHGRIVLSEEEVSRLRIYLLKGGFLYADDDYGMDDSFRKVMKQVFPDRELVELPFSHQIYQIHNFFINGLPKIHEHNNKPPQGFGIFDNTGRLVVFYTYETNLSDGWTDSDVHHDPPEKREDAFRMGVNIIVWALTH